MTTPEVIAGLVGVTTTSVPPTSVPPTYSMLIVGVVIPILVLVIGVVMTSFWKLSGLIKDVDKNLNGLITEGERHLSGLITEGDRHLSGLIDDVRDRYVRRDELDRDIKNINDTLKEIKESINRLAER